METKAFQARQEAFLAANGEVKVPAVTRERTLRGTTFQAAGVSKGLLSAKKMNESGHAVIFDGDMSFVVNEVNWRGQPLKRDVGFWQAAIASKKSGIKGIRPLKTFRGSWTEGARGYCEKKTIARKKRSRPKDKKRPSSKRFGTLGAQRPRNVSATTKPMFHFVHGAPCVWRQRVSKAHIILRSKVVHMRFLLLRLITNHSVNPVIRKTTKEQH